MLFGWRKTAICKQSDLPLEEITMCWKVIKHRLIWDALSKLSVGHQVFDLRSVLRVIYDCGNYDHIQRFVIRRAGCMLQLYRTENRVIYSSVNLLVNDFKLSWLSCDGTWTHIWIYNSNSLSSIWLENCASRNPQSETYRPSGWRLTLTYKANKMRGTVHPVEGCTVCRRAVSSSVRPAAAGKQMRGRVRCGKRHNFKHISLIFKIKCRAWRSSIYTKENSLILIIY